MKKTMVASGIAMVIGAPVANAAPVSDLFGAFTWDTDRANFTMLTSSVTTPYATGGAMVGGSNDVLMHWDGNGFNSDTDYTGVGSVSNVTATSTQPFNNNTWTAHDIQVFTPGTYSFDTTLDGGNNESGILTATVGAGQMGMHMLFDWNGNLNIDVFVVAAVPDQANPSGFAFGSGIGTKNVASPCTYYNLNCLWTGKGWAGQTNANAPSGGQTWMLSSVDGDGDGVPGILMKPGGPFAGFEASFNANLVGTPKVIPVPAAVWLFGSGLLGLVGVARRRKKS
jgi:hypothetical protein